MTKSREDSLKEDFMRCLHKICKQLSQDDLVKMKFFLTNHKEISRVKLEDASSAEDLMVLLLDRDIIAYNKTNKLVKILEDIERGGLKKELDNFNKLLRLTRSAPHNVKENMVVKHFKETQTCSKLTELLSKEHVVTLTGLQGSGKSQNALWYGCQHKKLYPDSTIWRCYANDKNAFQSSLQYLADELRVSEHIPETRDADAAISLTANIILDELKNNHIEGFHLIIIDDVGEVCTRIVQRFVDSFISQDSNTKFIITTIKCISTFKARIHLEGFSDEDSVAFLSEGQEDIDQKKEKEFLVLSKALGHLPMLLYAARTYITTTCVGPATFLKYLNSTENLDLIDKELKSINIESEEKPIFNALRFHIFEFFQKNVSPNVFGMFQMLQFLDINDIPLLLFDFMVPEDKLTSAALVTNSLVLAIQSNSFGTIRGKEDTRYLNSHSAVALTLGMCTKQAEKATLLKKLLWAFALLLNKDVFRKKDLQRQKLLLPHMRSMLSHAEKCLPGSFEDLVLMAFVNDLVGYAHNFEGLRKMAGEYSDKAKEYCYKIINQTEEEIDEEMGKSNETEATFSTFEEFIKKKSQHIHTKLSQISESKKDLLKEIVQNFVVTRYRVPDNMQLLSSYIGETQSDLHINQDEYNRLVKEELAVPLHIISRTFLHELILSIFYTYGRRLFYIDPEIEKILASKFYDYLYLAKEIGQRIKEEQSKFQPLDILLSERNGTLESCFNNKIRRFEHDRKAQLGAAVDRFKALFEEETKYYVHGVLKMNASEDDHHKTNCLKQLLRCFTTMIGMEDDINQKKEIYSKGCEYAETVLSAASHIDMQDRRSLPGIKVRVAEFYSCSDAPEEKIRKAEELFQDVCPRYLFEKDAETVSESQLGRHEKAAAYGLIDCYTKCNEKERAINLLWNLKKQFESNEDERELQKLSKLYDQILLLGKKDSEQND